MPKRQIIGTVVSDKNEKTRIVRVDRILKHELYEKRYTQSKKYYVHDENNESAVGDEVLIEEARAQSKTKRWILVEVTKKAQ